MSKNFFHIDIKRCVGCYACVIACMDQNDLKATKNEPKWRDVKSFFDEERLKYVSLACMHCQDAPCVASCKTLAIVKNPITGLVGTDETKCNGCRMCAKSCTFGFPKFNDEGKIQKCNGCEIRVAYGYEPACVKICPTKALKYGFVENLEKEKNLKMLSEIINR